MGRVDAARPQQLRAGAAGPRRRADPRPRPRRDAGDRLGPGDRPRGRGGLGGPARAVRARGPGAHLPGRGRLRTGRVRGLAGGGGLLGAVRGQDRRPLPGGRPRPAARGLEGGVRRRRPHPGLRGAVASPRSRPHPRDPGARGRGGALHRCARSRHRRVRGPDRRLPHRGRPRRAPGRLGGADRGAVPGLRSLGDPSERAGDRRPHGAPDPGGVRPRPPPPRERGELAPRDGGDEARLRGRPPPGRRPRLRGRAGRGDAEPGLRGRPARPCRGAGARPRAGGPRLGRHGVPVHRRPGRDDGEPHPVQLPRFRERHRGSRHRHRPSQPRARLHPGGRPPERVRPRQAPLPHHHPRLPDPGRPARRAVRGDGSADAAPGPYPGGGGDAGPWAESPGGARRPPLAGPRRPRCGHRARGGGGYPPCPRRPRPPPGVAGPR